MVKYSYSALLGGLIFLSLCLIGLPAQAQQISALAKLPQSKLVPGEQVRFAIYFFNEAEESVELLLPAEVKLLIGLDQQTADEISAFAIDDTEQLTQLAQGAFVRKQYRLSVPLYPAGTRSYSIVGYPESSGVFQVQRPRSHRAEPAEADTGTTTAQQSLRSLEPLYQTYASNLSNYQPVYFLVGSNPEKSKFQISFKYRLFNPAGSLAQRYPWLSGFHLGYTQTSFWDLAAESIPFADTSYKPELFFRSNNFAGRPDWIDGLFFQTGLQHESNGRDGELSRSTNYLYFKPSIAFYNQSSQLGLMISPRFHLYVNNEDDTNPDLADYRGYAELETKIGKAHSLMLATRFRFAEQGTSFQADLTYPIHRRLKNNLDLYFQLQYSNSLAESLIHDRQRTEAFRIGFSLVR